MMLNPKYKEDLNFPNILSAHHELARSIDNNISLRMQTL